MRFLDSKDLVYEVSERGYIIPIGEGMVTYNTFFATPEINVSFNLSASVILKYIDGKRTLEEILDETFDLYEGITRDRYIGDFMDAINHMERSGVVYSTVERKRYKNIQAMSRKAMDANLAELDRNVL